MGRRRYTAAGATGDHGFLLGLVDDDHAAYQLTKARGGLPAEIPEHLHSGGAEAGQLDWDDIWSDAVHTHLVAGEGGQLDHGAALTGLGDDDHPQYTLDPHGAAQHTDVTRELFLPAFNDSDVDATLANHGRYSVVELTDGVDSVMYFIFKVPDDFVSFTSLELVWGATAAAGNLSWAITASYGAAGESYLVHSDAVAPGRTATGGTNSLNVQEPENVLTLANLAIGDYLGIQLIRDATNVLDTLDVFVKVYGLLFTYVASQ